MKTSLLTTMCATLIIGVGGLAFAADGSGPIQDKTTQHHSVAPTRAMKGVGTWPSHWAKGDESLATDALNDLEAHGYSTFSNFHKKGNDFEATVSEAGKTYQVLIDPAKRTVTLES